MHNVIHRQFSHQNLVDTLIQSVLEQATHKKLFIVGITGLDASGKSKLAEQMAKKLKSAGRHVFTISGDSFQYPREYKEKLVEQSWALQHIKRTINFQSMIDDLFKPLQLYPRSLDLNIINYDLGTSARQTFQLSYPLIVMVESIYLFQKSTLPYLDFKIFLEVSMGTALLRAQTRPRDLKLYGSVEGIKKKYMTKNFAGYQLFEKQFHPKEFADIIIKNDNWQYPVVLAK